MRNFAALCWGFYSLMMIPANKKYDTVFITRKVFFYGLLSMIPYYLLYPEETSNLPSFSSSILLNLLFLGCVASMLCFYALFPSRHPPYSRWYVSGRQEKMSDLLCSFRENA